MYNFFSRLIWTVLDKLVGMEILGSVSNYQSSSGMVATISFCSGFISMQLELGRDGRW